MVFTAQQRLVRARVVECLPINASDILDYNDPFAMGQILVLMHPPFPCLLCMARCLCAMKGRRQTREAVTFSCAIPTWLCER